MVRLILLAVVFGLMGCGRVGPPNLKFLPSIATKQRAPEAGICPIDYKASGFCGRVQWNAGPLADKESSFDAYFWKKGRGAVYGPYFEPPETPKAFFQMKCCGTITRVNLVAKHEGHYRADPIKLRSGEYRLYVQWGKGTPEKTFVDVTVP